MGEPLYDQVVGAAGLNRPCRIYAPVGTHETLLAYLVRRLLENGANSSFVHRSADHRIAASELIADPAEVALAMPIIGAPHEKIAAPGNIFGSRLNSWGLDLADENSLNNLSVDLQASASKTWHAMPLICGKQSEGIARKICNPGNVQDQVGDVVEPQISDVVSAMGVAIVGWPVWNKTPVAQRAEVLEGAADIMQSRITTLMGLIMREAGKSAANAIAEVREAIDFLRYYASEARATLAHAESLGVVVCISPWNFPLAIFAGQIAAALAAGNSVVAKPAEETPLIAYEALRILHEAGVPREVLQFLPGDGAIGAALVAANETTAVMFTGATEVARLINMTLAKRLSAAGKPIPLIAETGGQNAMIVDSSALAEQVVGDVITSAFDSAGQRCSALRVLCLQEDIAERVLAMIKGAMRELCVGNTTALATDVGPVISADAKRIIEAHVETMQKLGCDVYRQPLGAQTSHGNFVAPVIIEINSLDELKREVFGPVLHVLRYSREQLDELIDAINGTGYGLTFGLHTRLDETIEHVTRRIKAGNLYINRNTIGAVVGLQPFGGTGLSGTGPKAGGPLYLYRLTNNPAPELPVGEMELSGPVGERNLYALHPRGRVLCITQTPEGLAAQKRIVAETGNECFVAEEGWESKGPYATALIEAEGAALIGHLQSLAAMSGPIITAQVAPYCKAWLMEEKSISINTTASGGNASLMTIG